MNECKDTRIEILLSQGRRYSGRGKNQITKMTTKADFRNAEFPGDFIETYYGQVRRFLLRIGMCGQSYIFSATGLGRIQIPNYQWSTQMERCIDVDGLPLRLATGWSC